MHILILPSWYKTPANPLRGNFFTEQAHALQKAGHQVGIIVPPSRFRTWHGLSQFTSNLNRKPKEFLWNTDDGFPVCVMPRWGLASIVSRRARVDLAAEAFGAYRDAYGHPEIIHAHSLLYAGFLGAKLGQRHQIPVVLTEHLSVLIRGPIWPDQRRVIRYALGQSRKVFAVSRPLADALRQFDPGVDIELIGNTVDSTFFQHTHPPERHPFRLTCPPKTRILPHILTEMGYG